MKKLITIVCIVTALATLLVMALPLAVSADDKGSSVTIQANTTGGSGNDPLVKAKWETSNASVTGESGDTGHATPGTQIEPILGFQNKAPIRFYAIVAWGSNDMTTGKVYADVYYPHTGTTDPGAHDSLKFEIPLTSLGTGSSIVSSYWTPAWTVGANLVKINDATPNWPAVGGTKAADITEELTEGLAYLYYADYYFDNCELAGDYTVIVHANTGATNLDGSLTNTITWNPLQGSDFDFGSVNYSANGPVAVGAHVIIGGDKVWDYPTTGAAPNPNPATIRNIGNTYIQMLVKEDDMGLGMTGNDWNVHFDARLGNSAAYTNFDPVAVATTNHAALYAAGSTVVGVVNSTQILGLCSQEKIDFSITVTKDPVEYPTDTHIYNGTMVLGSQSASTSPDVGTETGYTTQPPITTIVPATTTHTTTTTTTGP